MGEGAVSCSGCGRRYDPGLFEMGRTIHCTCGRRVGQDARLRPAVPPDRPRFIADAMLGRLARWLRTLGYDTAYDDAIEDSDLVRRAIEEGRHILTRDRRLFEEWRVDGLLISGEKPMEQLREVVGTLGLHMPRAPFARCRVCNGMLEPVEKSAIEDRVPPRVAEREWAFLQCPGCGRVYWEGTHTERMRRLLRGVFD